MEGKDDVTGEELIHRADDSEETVRNRLGIYHDQTKPLVAFYKKFEETNPTTKYVHVAGVGSLEDITAKVMGSLGA